MMSPVQLSIQTEDATQHWQFAQVANKRVLDLGCGNFGILAKDDSAESLGYFLSCGASFVLGVDTNSKDIAYLSTKYATAIADGRVVLRQQKCEVVSDIQSLIEDYHIQVVKSDIEGFEFLLEWLPESVVETVESWYIEAHGGNLLRSIPLWAYHRGLHCTAEITLRHATTYPCAVYFFERV